MATISIQLPAPLPQSYAVHIEPGLLARLGSLVRAVAPAPECALISDSHVAPLYLPAARAALQQAGYRVLEHVIPAGEAHKTLATATAVFDDLLGRKVERATPVIALGGGVVGDLAGFVAATLLRGVPFIQVPTTLLAAVDASVGGKVAVDHPAGKNLIGAFHQPRLVATDIATFQTLPPRELRCGLAECIKHAIIRDADLFAFLSQNLPKIMTSDPALLTDLVARNVRIKADIVMQDPYETGVRALLNLGHTFGHALETLGGYSHLQHGEAVALGTIAASRLAVGLGKLPPEDLPRIITLIDYAGLPTSLPGLHPDDVFAAMATDKKARGGKLRFVLPTSIGSAEVFTDLDPVPVKNAIASLGDPALNPRC